MPELTDPKMDFADTSDLRKVVRNHFDKLSNEPPAVMPEGYSAPLSTTPLNVQIREAHDITENGPEREAIYDDGKQDGYEQARAQAAEIYRTSGACIDTVLDAIRAMKPTE